MYNSIMTVSILLIAAYGLYHHQPVDNHDNWTQCDQAECQRRQGKINYD
jgi:hypothetical protein